MALSNLAQGVLTLVAVLIVGVLAFRTLTTMGPGTVPGMGLGGPFALFGVAFALILVVVTLRTVQSMVR